MLKGIEAVIFDMDGVIIDSEPLWRRVMIKHFAEAGIPFTEDHCRITTGLRFKEVVAYWFAKHNITHITVTQFDANVIAALVSTILKEGRAMAGVIEALKKLKAKGFKLAVGTSSDIVLMDAVLDALEIRSYFSELCSAQNLKYGKPHPEVFLRCADILDVNPHNCLVIEDSVNGIIAAKAAKMKVLAIPDAENRNNPKFCLADFQLGSLIDFLV